MCSSDLPTQNCPRAQARAQAPQLASSSKSETSQPLAVLLSQLPKPRAQDDTAQAPAVQAAVVAAYKPHAEVE